jgi:hypothetical protein
MIKDRIDVLKEIFVKWLQGLLEIVAFFPILLTLGVLIIPADVWIWMICISGSYLLGLVLGSYLLKKPRYAHIVAGILINTLWILLLSQGPLTKIVVFLSGIIIFDRGIRFRGSKWADMFPDMAIWVALLLYLLGGLIYSFVPVLKPYFHILAWTGFVYTIIVLFTINTEQLKTAAQPAEGSVPVFSSTVIRNNRILILLSIALIMFISYFDDFKNACVWLFQKIGQGILAVLLFLSKLSPISHTGPREPMSQDPLEILPEMEVGEPSLFAIILEKIIMVIGGAVSLVLIWFALKILFRLIKEAFKWLLEFLKSYVMYQENVGFIDEKEKLIGLADIGRDYRDRFQNWLKSILEREPKWEELQNNHQRIRFLYRHLILRCLSRGYTYKKYLTPKETALDILDWDGDISPEIRDLTHAYDETRYGQTAIEDSKVHQLAKTFLEKQRRF